MLRYAIIVVLITCHVKAQKSDDADEQTLEWIKNNFPQNEQNNQNNENSSPAPPAQTTENVDDIVKWVSDFIKTESKNETKKDNAANGFNLDPANVKILNSSLSKPAETSNKFDDEINDTNPVEKPCTTEEGVSGVCVLYYLCDQNTRKVIGDGTHLIDVRFGSSEKDCPHYLDVCCQLEDRVTQSSAEEVMPKRPMPASKPPGQSLADPLPEGLEPAPGKRECGWNNPDLFVFQPATQDIADRGVYANYGDFPWMVALLRKSGTSVWVQNDYIGGGSLIHPSVVITAYHKLLQVTAEELKCRAGEWDTQTDKEQYKIQERDAERFVSHPDFFRTSAYNDVALIFLKSPFDLAKAPHIGTACLSSVLPDSATCFSMGWGKDIQSDEYVNILKKIRLPLVEHERCETLLHTNTRFRHIPKFVLHESLMCAGGVEGVDTCQGDGGSSLVCPIGHRDRKTRYAVVGMVAYGLACGNKDVPGVYVNVPHLYEWVEREMSAAGYDNSTYSF